MISAANKNLLLSTPDDYSDDKSSSKAKKGKWTAEEDELLSKYVAMYGEKQWRKISQKIYGRTPIQCLHRWSKILKPGLVKGPWTTEEDKKLSAWVKANGPGKWAQAAKHIQGRSGKQCRERWFNNLDPSVKKGDWSKEEDETIFALYNEYGSSWSQIAKMMPGRTENAIKNRFYSTLRRLGTIPKKDGDGLSLSQVKKEEKESVLDAKQEEKLPVVVQKEVNEDHLLQIEQSSNDLSSVSQELAWLACPEVMPIIEDSVPKDYDLNIDTTFKEKIVLGKSYGGMPEFEDERETLGFKEFHFGIKAKQDVQETNKEFEHFLAIQDFNSVSSSPVKEYHAKTEEKQIDINIDNRIKNIQNTLLSYSHSYSHQHKSKLSENVVTTGAYNFNLINSGASSVQTSSSYVPQSVSESQQKPVNSLSHQVNFSPVKKSLITVKNLSISCNLSPSNSIPSETSSNTQAPLPMVEERSQLDGVKLSQRIVEECVSQNVNGIDRINNLIYLFKVFANQNIETMGLFHSDNNGKRMNEVVVTELIQNMYKAVKSASIIHYNYVRYLLGILKELPSGDLTEINRRMEYLFSQLSTLENLLMTVRNKISALEMASRNMRSVTPNYGVHSMVSQEVRIPGRNAITIKIGSLNSGLEEISKKRVLG